MRFVNRIVPPMLCALVTVLSLSWNTCYAEISTNLPELSQQKQIFITDNIEDIFEVQGSVEEKPCSATGSIQDIRSGNWQYGKDELYADFPNLNIRHTDNRKRRVLSSRGAGSVSQDYQNITPSILKCAQKYNINPYVIRAVIAIESSYNPKAYSSSGACGLMQLKPGTALDMGVRDYWVPHRNIEAGTRYLRLMLDKFGSLDVALAAYNQGPGTVQRCGGKIPNATARHYIKKFYQALETMED